MIALFSFAALETLPSIASANELDERRLRWLVAADPEATAPIVEIVRVDEMPPAITVKISNPTKRPLEIAARHGQVDVSFEDSTGPCENVENDEWATLPARSAVLQFALLDGRDADRRTIVAWREVGADESTCARSAPFRSAGRTRLLDAQEAVMPAPALRFVSFREFIDSPPRPILRLVNPTARPLEFAGYADDSPRHFRSDSNGRRIGPAGCGYGVETRSVPPRSAIEFESTESPDEIVPWFLAVYVEDRPLASDAIPPRPTQRPLGMTEAFHGGIRLANPERVNDVFHDVASVYRGDLVNATNDAIHFRPDPRLLDVLALRGIDPIERPQGEPERLRSVDPFHAVRVEVVLFADPKLVADVPAITIVRGGVEKEICGEPVLRDEVR